MTTEEAMDWFERRAESITLGDKCAEAERVAIIALKQQQDVKQLEAENTILRKVLELAILNHTIDSKTADVKLQRYINFVKKESENES